MPNNSDARRDKREKKKNRNRQPPPIEEQVPAESVESFLSRSSADSGLQGDDDNFSWESVGGQAALDNSLSSLARSSSVSETKQARKERRKRERSVLLEQELEDESDITLSDESVDKEDSGSRKLSLSPTQFLQSRATGTLNRSRAMRQEAMENPSALASPVQVLEVKGKEASFDVPVEAVASVIASGAKSIQRDNQGRTSTRILFRLPSLPFFQSASYRACAIASSQSCSRADSGWIWKIPSYPPSETLSEAWHCYLHECPHCC
jgi:hypothetical protein